MFKNNCWKLFKTYLHSTYAKQNFYPFYMFSHLILRTLLITYCYVPSLKMKKLRHREVMQFAHNCTSIKWWYQDSKPGTVSRIQVLSYYICCLSGIYFQSIEWHCMRRWKSNYLWGWSRKNCRKGIEEGLEEIHNT